jgi:hypothetical protein
MMVWRAFIVTDLVGLLVRKPYLYDGAVKEPFLTHSETESKNRKCVFKNNAYGSIDDPTEALKTTIEKIKEGSY